ncbi:Hypothetical protein LUCI_2368 [Lucifera butyrica]|uniref:Uncharacterized protein n=1 Tax=Lucifera butyrica TaxID=1351585 RepID=A0A498R6K3_9FIRM|nr:hypothetical protein [Lucifera butyrica]VBB07124.1 Hypothetical protein LUCI_2368 [Lucifera butyrica]
MKKLDSLLLKVFLYGLPLIIVLAVFSYLHDSGIIASAYSYLEHLYNFAGFMFALWMLLSVYLGIRLMFSGTFREKVLTRITFIKERDEREVMLTGKAAKTTMLTTLAILIFFFCLSCFQVSVYRIPPENAVHGKTGVISIGLNFSLLENPPQDAPQTSGQKQNIFTYSGLPVSNSAVILGVIAWQIIAYNYSMRRLMK